MTILNYYDTPVTLTELEAKVIKELSTCDEYDERPFCHIDDLRDYTGIDSKQLRGVVSSLSQKDVVILEESFWKKGENIVFYLGKNN